MHRLLASSLNDLNDLEVNKDTKYVEAIADHCNDKKASSRVCSQKSADMFLALYLRVIFQFFSKIYFM